MNNDEEILRNRLSDFETVSDPVDDYRNLILLDPATGEYAGRVVYGSGFGRHPLIILPFISLVDPAVHPPQSDSDNNNNNSYQQQ